MIIVSNLSKIVRAVHKSGELLEFLGVLLALANPIREREIGMKRHGQIFIVSVFHSYRCFPFSWQWMSLIIILILAPATGGFSGGVSDLMLYRLSYMRHFPVLHTSKVS